MRNARVACISLILVISAGGAASGDISIREHIEKDALPPIPYVAEKLRHHDVVLLGEAHWVQHDAQLVRDPVPTLATERVMLAIKMVPAGQQDDVGSFVNAEIWNKRLAMKIMRAAAFPYREYLESILVPTRHLGSEISPTATSGSNRCDEFCSARLIPLSGIRSERQRFGSCPSRKIGPDWLLTVESLATSATDRERGESRQRRWVDSAQVCEHGPARGRSFQFAQTRSTVFLEVDSGSALIVMLKPTRYRGGDHGTHEWRRDFPGNGRVRVQGVDDSPQVTRCRTSIASSTGILADAAGRGSRAGPREALDGTPSKSGRESSEKPGPPREIRVAEAFP